MKKFLKTVKNALFGAGVGLVNGLFGAGGGLICVPLLIKSGMPRKQAHANAVAIILAVSTVSAGSYLLAGRFGRGFCWYANFKKKLTPT